MNVQTPSDSELSFVEQSAHDRIFRKVGWRLLPLLFLGYVIAYIDRVNIGFAKLQMMNDLAFSDVVYGLGAGIFFIGFSLVEIPSNLILYRVGARAWLARIMVTWGILSVLMMFVETPATFYVLRFLIGAAEAGFLPGVIYYLTVWFPAERRGRVFSIFTSGAAVGGVAVGPLCGWIMTHMNELADLRGWQWVFILQGGAAVVIGIMLFMFLSDTPQDARWLDEDERRHLLARSEDVQAKRNDHRGFGAAFTDPQVWFLGLIFGVTNLGIYLGVFWLPTIIHDAGITNLGTIGLLTSLSYLGAVVMMLALGWSSDRLRERRWHIATILIVASLSLLVGANAIGSVVLGVGGLMVSTALFIGVTPVMWVHVSSFIEGKAAAAGFALINVCAGVAAFLAPYMMGLVDEQTGSTEPVLYGVAVSVLIGAMLLVTVRLRSSAERR